MQHALHYRGSTSNAGLAAAALDFGNQQLSYARILIMHRADLLASVDWILLGR